MGGCEAFIMNSTRPQKRSPARAQQMEHHWRSAPKIEMHSLFKMWVTPEIQKKKDWRIQCNSLICWIARFLSNSALMGNLAVSKMCVYSSLMSVNEILSAFLKDTDADDLNGYFTLPAEAAGNHLYFGCGDGTIIRSLLLGLIHLDR